MGVIWDYCTVTIENKTALSMNILSASVGAGNFSPSPPGSIAAGIKASYELESEQDNCHDGCSGIVIYEIADGTRVVIDTKTSYFYGPMSQDHYNCSVSGDKADRYRISGVSSHDSCCGGAGKSDSYAVTLEKA